MKILSRYNLINYKRILIISLLLLALTFSYVTISRMALATRATDFQAGRIIDDEIFYDTSTMTAADIQSFLDKQITRCDTWGNEKASDLGHPNITRSQLAKQKWNISPPFVCLNNYHENPSTGETSFERGGGKFPGGISAAEIIYSAAKKYDINPQVLIILLKKESAGPLTNDTWPLKRQYRYAMGYACPDNGPGHSANCSNSRAGFYKQVHLAAWQLKYYKDHPNDYAYKLGWNKIRYSPDPSCGTKDVYIENLATLSLYIYTPYTPNDSALRNYPGTASCGAYGNRNFFMYFHDLFGSTLTNSKTPRGQIKQRHEQLGGDTGILGPSTSIQLRNGNVNFQYFNNGVIVGSDRTGYWESMGQIRSRWVALNYEHGILGLPIGGITKNGDISYQQYQKGFITGNGSVGYWESLGSIRKRWAQLGYDKGVMGSPTSPEMSYGQAVFQRYQNGYITGNGSVGYWESRGPIRTRWASLDYERGKLGFPTSNIIALTNAAIKQTYQHGVIYGSPSTGYWEVIGEVGDYYHQKGAEKSTLGLPLAPEKWINDRWSQEFDYGFIVGSGGHYKIVAKP
ncbi:MAG: hypothetical protein Q4A34_00805 [Candidatus Saccharibacteria bacterium]|nr:hypothetical protein [Candidatus Saccharibacteria bacterium]